MQVKGQTMANLTFYGGINEIGGNKILVNTEDGTILLDFGRRMGAYNKYYSEFLQARSKNALRDLLRLDILPKIDGVYAPHLADTTVLFENQQVSDVVPLSEAPDYWKTIDVSPCDKTRAVVDGVFVTHAHFDHMQDVSFLDPSIPVYCTEKTKVLAKAMTDVSVSGVDDQYYMVSKKMLIQQKKACFKTLCPGECECSPNKENPKPVIEDPKTGFKFTWEFTPTYRSFKTAAEGHIKGIAYKMIPVGHSVPGACSVLLNLPDGKRVLYTGDVRFHADGEVSVDEYVNSIGGPVDVLITEGTRIGSDEVLKEEQIGEAISGDIEGAAGLVLVNFGWKDLTRFFTVYEAAKKHKRTLVVSPKLAYLLYEMHHNFPVEYEDPRKLPNLKVYLKREGDLLYSRGDYAKFKMGYLNFHGRNIAQDDRNLVRVSERLGLGGDPNNPKNPLPLTSENEPYDYKALYELATHHLDHGIRAYKIRQSPEKYVLMFTYWDANELFDVLPHDGSHQTVYVCASTEPFNEEMEIDETKFVNWLDFFKVSYEFEEKNGLKLFIRRHVSGHASRAELKMMIEKINPAKIIPVHTEHPEIFEAMFPGKIVLPKYGQVINV